MNSNLIGALKAGSDHLGDSIHTILRLLDDSIHFGEGCRFAHRRVLYCELELLYVRRDLVDMIQQLFLQSASWYLVFQISRF